MESLPCSICMLRTSITWKVMISESVQFRDVATAIERKKVKNSLQYPRGYCLQKHSKLNVESI